MPQIKTEVHIFVILSDISFTLTESESLQRKGHFIDMPEDIYKIREH